MGGNDETIARLISKRAKLDPTGFAAASKRGDIKGYCQTELKRLGISEEEFKQFLNLISSLYDVGTFMLRPMKLVCHPTYSSLLWSHYSS